MAVEILFPEGLTICKMLLKVNFFAAQKGKSLNCRVFIEAEMSFLCVYAKFHIIYFQIIFYSSLIQFFFIQFNFFKFSSKRYKFDVVQEDKTVKEMSFKAVLGDL